MQVHFQCHANSTDLLQPWPISLQQVLLHLIVKKISLLTWFVFCEVCKGWEVRQIVQIHQRLRGQLVSITTREDIELCASKTLEPLSLLVRVPDTCHPFTLQPAILPVQNIHLLYFITCDLQTRKFVLAFLRLEEISLAIISLCLNFVSPRITG
jgi:hypothetical protein